MSAWEDVLLDSDDRRNPAEWWWAYVTDVDPLRIRRELETHPIGSTPSTIEAGLQVGDKVRVVNYLGQALIVGRAGGGRFLPELIEGQVPLDKLPIAAGTVPITGSGAQTAAVTVTLPAGRFAATPVSTATATNSNYFAYIIPGSSTNETSLRLGLRHWNGTNWSATLDVNWTAVEA